MSALTPGSRIGHYEVVSAIGAGGMGEVYRARDTRLNRDVALKLLPSTLAFDPVRRARFVGEARAASALEHPNIAVIHDIGEVDGSAFIVMELVRGTPLSDLIAEGPLTPARATELGSEIVEGLARAHEVGIIHRDLKPANVMVTDEGHAKIIDFGLAKLLDAFQTDAATVTRGAPMTEAGLIVGTFAYMSPEQARGTTFDHRSDLFSFGIVLFEMLTGTAPFRGKSSVETMHAILHEPTPALSLNSPIADDLRRIVGKCLAKDPGDRYQSTRDLVVDLRAARRRLEGSSTGTRAALIGSRGAGVLVGTTVALALTAAVTVSFFLHRARAVADHQAAVAQVEHLVDIGRFVDAWRVGRASLRRWPADSEIERMLRATSQTVTLATDPPGADVAFKAYDDLDGPWVPLGTSPVSGASVPLGMLRWRLTKAGFDPIEARLEVGTPAAAVGHPDVDARPIRLRPLNRDFERMVFVPGGVQDGVPLKDYWMDRTEVTNRDFKAFIEHGGYEDTRHWRDLEGTGGRAALRFSDRTGRPGPSIWELGTYPEGRADYPVAGVSWFEAVAYCRSVGKSLPTHAHWKRAFGAAFFEEVVRLGNFGGRGPESTAALKDVGPFGTVGMSGNVKEWVWNELDGERYILGGAWNEPPYMAVDDDARPPGDRAETNGFRCVSETAPSAPAAYAASRRSIPRDFAHEKPVDDATFEVMRRFYSYDHTPLNARIEAVEQTELWRRERVSFTAAYGGERVLANILIPKNASPPYQVVVWFPGAYALGLRKSDGDLPFSYYFDFLPRSGRALVYPVYKGTYERSQPIETDSEFRDVQVQWAKDVSRTIDYLDSRSDFDKDRIAYYGFSMGAVEIHSLALEPRLKAAILLAGGLARTAEKYPETELLNFLPRIKIPVLQLGGEYDFEFDAETSQKPMFALIGTPPEHKRLIIFEHAGHVPPRIDVIRNVLDWLDRYLGPVASRGH